jgi:hypothetical protein
VTSVWEFGYGFAAVVASVAGRAKAAYDVGDGGAYTAPGDMLGYTRGGTHAGTLAGGAVLGPVNNLDKSTSQVRGRVI